MGEFAQYILSVTATALICGIIGKIPVMDGTVRKITQLSAGIVVMFAVIHPISRLQIGDPTTWLDSLYKEAEGIVAEGTQQANTALAKSIKEQTQAYILDKAASLGVTLEVEIVMSQDACPVPVGAVIRGDISPYCKARITEFMEAELGITGENQTWN